MAKIIGQRRSVFSGKSNSSAIDTIGLILPGKGREGNTAEVGDVDVSSANGGNLVFCVYRERINL